uniref:Uncharacterized protein n=1 Tax=Toxoplasma gondii (strain ATCC 50861 / VEG) TaxID=432359 RepID=A0A0F7VD77_TOXGV|nr:TPA: hypothetical protein BN1205_002420 [Toxoplasma gondii VEG]
MARRPGTSDLNAGENESSRTAKESPKSPAVVWRVKKVAVPIEADIDTTFVNLGEDTMQKDDADQVAFDFAECGSDALTSKYNSSHVDDDESEAGGTEFEEQQTRAQTSATSDMDYWCSVNQARSPELDEGDLSNPLRGETHSTISEGRTGGSAGAVTTDDPATAESFETAYGGDSMLATLACAASEDTNFPQSNESASSILSNTSRLSEEVLAQLNENTRSISSCISRAQLLLGQLTDTANSQLESGATNGVHHMTEVGQTVRRASLEEYMVFQEQLTPHQDDDEISFELSQDSDGEGVTSPLHEDSRVRSIGPIDEPEPLSQPPEFAPVANAKWEIREATKVRPPRPASTVPRDQVSTGDEFPLDESENRPRKDHTTASGFPGAGAPVPTPAVKRISSTVKQPPGSPKSKTQLETSKQRHPIKTPKNKTQLEKSKDSGSIRPCGRSCLAAKSAANSNAASTSATRGVTRTGGNATKAQDRSAKGPAARGRSVSSVLSTSPDRKTPHPHTQLGSAPTGTSQPKPTVHSRQSCSPAVASRVSAAELIKQITGAAAANSSSPTRSPSWTELPAAAREKIVEILHQQRIVLTSGTTIRQAVEAIRRACGKTSERSLAGSSGASSRSSNFAGRGVAGAQKGVFQNETAAGNSGVAPRSASRKHQSLPRRFSLCARSRLGSATNPRPQQNRHLRRSLSENQTSLLTLTPAPRASGTRGRSSIGSMLPGQLRSNSRLLCPHGLRYKSLCTFCSQADASWAAIASKGFAQPTVSSRMQETETRRLFGTCAGRRATPLKANASRAKLWAAGGISRATVETVVSGVGARSRSSVGAASWTSASSALSRASIGSKTRDSSVEPLPGDRVVGAPPRGRSRNSRPLAQQARGPKASGETPAVFQRLWEGAMERQRARSRDAPAVSGAARLIVPRHSLGSSTGSNNSSSAQRRSISEKNGKTPARALVRSGQGVLGAEEGPRRPQTGGPSAKLNASPRTATQTPCPQGKRPSGQGHPFQSPATASLWHSQPQFPPPMHGQQPLASQDQWSLNQSFQMNVNQNVPLPVALPPISPPFQSIPIDPLRVANHHVALNSAGQPGYALPVPPPGVPFGLRPSNGTNPVPYMTPNPRARSPPPNPSMLANTSAFNPVYQQFQTSSTPPVRQFENAGMSPQQKFQTSSMPPQQYFQNAGMTLQQLQTSTTPPFHQFFGPPPVQSQFVPVPFPQGPGAGASPAIFYTPQAAQPASETPERGVERFCTAHREGLRTPQHPTNLPASQNELKTPDGKAEAVCEVKPTDSRMMKEDPTVGLSSLCISNLHIESRPIPRLVPEKQPSASLPGKRQATPPRTGVPFVRTKSGRTSIRHAEVVDKNPVGEGAPLPKTDKGEAPSVAEVKETQGEMHSSQSMSACVESSGNRKDKSRQELWQEAWKLQVAQWQQSQSQQGHSLGHSSEAASAKPFVIPAPSVCVKPFTATQLSTTPISTPKEGVFQANDEAAVPQQTQHTQAIPHSFSFATCPPLAVTSPSVNASLVHEDSNQETIPVESGAPATPVPTPAFSFSQLSHANEAGGSSQKTPEGQVTCQALIRPQPEQENEIAWGWPEAEEALAITIVEENGRVCRERTETEFEPALGARPGGAISRKFPLPVTVPFGAKLQPMAQRVLPTKTATLLSSAGIHNENNHRQQHYSGARPAGAQPTMSGTMLFKVGGPSGDDKRNATKCGTESRHANVYVCGPSGLADIQAGSALQRTLMAQNPFVRTKPVKSHGSTCGIPCAREMVNQKMSGSATTGGGISAAEPQFLL